MILFINDRVERIFDSNPTLHDLVKRLGKDKTAVMVTLNDIDIPKKNWKVTKLSDLDRVGIN